MSLCNGIEQNGKHREMTLLEDLSAQKIDIFPIKLSPAIWVRRGMTNFLFRWFCEVELLFDSLSSHFDILLLERLSNASDSNQLTCLCILSQLHIPIFLSPYFFFNLILQVTFTFFFNCSYSCHYLAHSRLHPGGYIGGHRSHHSTCRMHRNKSRCEGKRRQSNIFRFDSIRSWFNQSSIMQLSWNNPYWLRLYWSFSDFASIFTMSSLKSSELYLSRCNL